MSITIKPTLPNGRPYPDSEVPACDVANANARLLLATVGIDAGPWLAGAIGPDEVSGALAECASALGADAAGVVRRAPLLTGGSANGRHVTHGTDDRRARERLARLLDVLDWAVAHEAGIAW